MIYKQIIIFNLFLIYIVPSSLEGTFARALNGNFQKDYAQLVDNLSKAELAEIKAGFSLFSKPWVEAPSSTKVRDGLGPYFNAVSCMSCHVAMGRGNPQFKEYVGPALLFRITEENHPFGDQLQPRALPGLEAESLVKVKYEQKEFTFSDGEIVILHNPIYIFSNGTFNFSPRLAPHLAGLGLIEKITTLDLAKKHDPIDLDNDGISGRINWVNNRPGRFGLKAEHSSLSHQNAAAFNGDLGITSNLFPNENCSPFQDICLDQLSGGTPEIDDKRLGFVNLLIKSMAPPRKIKEPSEEGLTLFKQVKCSSCHTPSYIVNGVKISPYSDFLLHDMGDDLSDNGNSKMKKEWKTPPLWGIGRQKTVNGHTRHLHDGRARSIKEAILWHSGEAKESRNLFINLKKEEREELIEFLKSI